MEVVPRRGPAAVRYEARSEQNGSRLTNIVAMSQLTRLLVFIRNKDVTAAVKAAIAKIEEHPSYKRRSTNDADERVDFVMHTPGDPDREIHLALLPFALPGDASSRFSSQD